MNLPPYIILVSEKLLQDRNANGCSIMNTRITERDFTPVEFCRGADILQKCRRCYEVEVKSAKIKESILETHIDVKNQLIQNLEDIIDEQEARIRNMDDFIRGKPLRSDGRALDRHRRGHTITARRIRSLNPRNKQILKGISVLSLDFGALSDENLTLKESLLDAKRTIRLLQLQLSPYKKIAVSIDVDCQTDSPIEGHLIDAKSEDASKSEENNNVILKNDREISSTIRRNIDELRQTKVCDATPPLQRPNHLQLINIA
uniref:Tektin n=1 Tax=Ascaris lumbricoides TaxID=6252 RepID=A0A9J2Q0X8_ASCLU